MDVLHSHCGFTCEIVRANLAELHKVEEQEESEELYQTLFFSRSDSLLVMTSDSLK